jgi:beta-lactamase class A
MNKTIVLALLSISLFSCSPQEDQPPKVALNRAIVEILAQTTGDFAVAFKNLKNGDTLFINADNIFHAASTMKTPVMIELYRQAEAGNFTMDDYLIITNEFKSIVDGSAYTMDVNNDSEDELYAKIGSKITIRELIYQMITSSSNLATNILIELAGADEVTRSMRALGAADIVVLRGVEDLKAFDLGMNNTTTAYDLLLIMETIATGSSVSAKASAAMEKILLDQHFNAIIPAKLPANVKVAHKTGSITGVQHDSGIIILPGGDKYILVLLSKNLEDENRAVELMSQVSLLVYEFVVAP